MESKDFMHFLGLGVGRLKNGMQIETYTVCLTPDLCMYWLSNSYSFQARICLIGRESWCDGGVGEKPILTKLSDLSVFRRQGVWRLNSSGRARDSSGYTSYIMWQIVTVGC